jgi:dTDP-4-amino-4,6-dideoxygalactose transaminase
LKASRVGTEVYYPLPIHLQACFAHPGHRKGVFPIAELAAQGVLTLPCYPELSLDMREYVAENVLSGMNSLAAFHIVDNVAAELESVEG